MNSIATSPAGRFDRLDALRGLAIVWMAVFHFCFDLNHFGHWVPRQQFNIDPFWTTQRTCIVSLFLFCAGLGQAVAMGAAPGQPFLAKRFWKRWGQVALCAVFVSIGSAIVFPRSWIHFGVLHGIVVMLVLCRLLAPLRAGLWLVGALVIALPFFLKLPFFDGPWLNWTGLVTRKPVTEDYVPVLPWLGVMAWGLAAGQWLMAHRRGVLGGPLPKPLQPLAVLGRWSLSFYMVHQPVFFGLLTAWGGWRAA